MWFLQLRTRVVTHPGTCSSGPYSRIARLVAAKTKTYMIVTIKLGVCLILFIHTIMFWLKISLFIHFENFEICYNNYRKLILFIYLNILLCIWYVYIDMFLYFEWVFILRLTVIYKLFNKQLFLDILWIFNCKYKI